MKRIIFSLSFLILLLPVMSQSYVSVAGYVTDSLTGFAIPNHAVHITSDSSFGFVYTNTVYTNANGHYHDSISLTAGIDSGFLYIFTYDCNNALHSVSKFFGPNNMVLVQNFQICTNTPCMADFSWYGATVTVQFLNQSVGVSNPGPWFWEFGDGNTSTISSPQHTYSSGGSYIVSLTIGDSSTTCMHDTSHLVTVPDTIISCTAGFMAYPDSINPNLVYFVDQSTGNINSWSWNFGDPGSGVNNTSTTQNPSHIYTQPGSYLVCLTVQGVDSTCYDTYCDSIFITNSGGCQASFTYQSLGWQTIQFLDQSSGTSGPWFWNFGDNTYSYIQNPSHTYASPGYYNVKLVIGTYGTSCFDSTFQTVYVEDSTGGCQAGFYYFPDSLGNITTYQFIDQSTGNINSWFWDFGDGTTSTQQNPIHEFATTGFYTVCLTIEGADSLCYDTYCELINIGGPGNCQAQFTYYPDSLQNARLIHFVDLSYGDITSWYWDFGDSAFSSVQNPSHMFPEEGTYYVCLTITANANGAICQSTWCQDVTVGAGSDCSSYFTYQNNNLTISFTGHMVNWQPAIYSWDFGDGQSGQGQSVIHQYPVAGIYYVSLTTTTLDPAGCTYTTAQSITVGDSTQWNQVYGQVFAGNFPLDYGMVMIFSLDTSAGFVPFIDISMIDSLGIYYFSMVPLGNYLIYALPFLPTGYLPTYYGDVLGWENATVVSLGQAANPYDINLIEAYAYNPGNGGINGQITTAGLKGSFLDKITMLLMNEAGDGISYQQVDATGEFDFSALDYGVYFLKAELAGCQSDLVRVELTPENPVVDVVMTFTGNQILGEKDNSLTMEASALYPNPVRDLAQIDLYLKEGTTVFVELFNLSGQRVIQYTEYLKAGPATIAVPVGQLRDGLYTLRIYTNSGLNLSRKLLKSH